MPKRKAEDDADKDLLEVIPLGGGNEVGRSCILLNFKGKTIMLDCGVHPAFSGQESLPFFDRVDLSTVDAILISHFHLDHSAALPYLLERTHFKGRVFMTHPTKAIYKMMLTDFIKISNISEEDQLFTELDLQRSMDKIEVFGFHQEIDLGGVKFKAYNAGHVLGAAMFMIDIAGVKILYTGDYSLEEDRHLMGAEVPAEKPDILIVESTYGVQTHDSRHHREAMFSDVIHKTVSRGGRVLLPVFAVGRAQELLLILDEYWESHPELQGVPIYYASALAKKCMAVYETYINMMNERIKAQYAISNPFVFKHVLSLKSVEHFDDIGPSVVMASPGMLQSGLSRELFDMWCSNPKNAVVMAGYCVDGTLAKDIMNHPTEVTTLNNQVVPLRMSVHYISFSAHADYPQTSEFIAKLKPPHIILVHGDAREMDRLKQGLVREYEGQKVEVLTPKNTEAVKLKFRGEKMAKVVGSLAKGGSVHGARMSSVLVKKEFNHHVLHPDDLGQYTTLSTGSIAQNMTIPFAHAFSLAKHFLAQMFGPDGGAAGTANSFTIFDGCVVVSVPPGKKNVVRFEWESDPLNDMVADSAIALLMSIDGSPAAVKLANHKHKHDRMDPRKQVGKSTEEMKAAQKVLAERFGEVTVDLDGQKMEVVVDGVVASVTFPNLDVLCDSASLKAQVEEQLGIVMAAFRVRDIVDTAGINDGAQ